MNHTVGKQQRKKRGRNKSSRQSQSGAIRRRNSSSADEDSSNSRGSESSRIVGHQSRHPKKKSSGARPADYTDERRSASLSVTNNSSQSSVAAPDGQWRSIYCYFCRRNLGKDSGDDNDDLGRHLAFYHRSYCFRCVFCSKEWNDSFVTLAEATAHVQQQHPAEMEKEQNVVIMPQSLFLLTCHFCTTPRKFLGRPFANLQKQLAEHLEKHQGMHKGDQHVIDRQVISLLLYTVSFLL